MGHYYDADGKPRHTIIGVNGKERSTDVRDARRLGLVPSVSTIKDVGLSQFLVNWMMNMMLDIAIENKHIADIEMFRKVVYAIYKERKSKPSLVGNSVHKSMEHLFKTGEYDENKHYTSEAYSQVFNEFPGYTWTAEHSFSHPDGFGGCVDLHGSNGTDYVIIDFKTKDKAELSKSMQFEDYKVQLAGYQIGLELPEHTRRFNQFISVHKDTPGKSLLVECDKFDKYSKIFYAYLNLWKARNLW